MRGASKLSRGGALVKHLTNETCSHFRTTDEVRSSCSSVRSGTVKKLVYLVLPPLATLPLTPQKRPRRPPSSTPLWRHRTSVFYVCSCERANNKPHHSHYPTPTQTCTQQTIVPFAGCDGGCGCGCGDGAESRQHVCAHKHSQCMHVHHICVCCGRSVSVARPRGFSVAVTTTTTTFAGDGRRNGRAHGVRPTAIDYANTCERESVMLFVRRSTASALWSIFKCPLYSRVSHKLFVFVAVVEEGGGIDRPTQLRIQTCGQTIETVFACVFVCVYSLRWRNTKTKKIAPLEG